MVVVNGSDVIIAWTFDDPISTVFVRHWKFRTSNGTKNLAYIFRNQNTTIVARSRLPGVEIIKPGMLVLKNVDFRYNGTYRFYLLTPSGSFTSDVTVFVAGKPTVSVCSSAIVVNGGENVTCLCRGQGVNIPGLVNVTWFKDGAQIGKTESQQNELILNYVNERNSGNYTCRVQKYVEVQNETSVELIVEYPPEKPKFRIFSRTVELGKSVAMICTAKAVPEPRYIIVHNNIETISNDRMFIIDVVNKSHAGSYQCIAENKHGSSSKIDNLTVVDSEINQSFKDDFGKVWIVVFSVSGFVVGVLFSHILACFLRRFRSRKSQSNPELQTPEDNTNYQNLDITKMNAPENCESLTMNVVSNGEGSENDPTYAQLNTIRNDENNYQALT
ncbi:B-cell receptor CD22 isoform X1 [Paramuricea clavata]|uniref:B-cell receptor CD22 isoform X1 n=1 Tax=Paramuricea clavata TaxID=317549 RepID=A0A6S7GGC4_PARCT|nr:B-cell receptor CD22 isoform X1 [Paramuricea clavata]